MPNTTVKAAGTSWPTPSLPQFQRQFNPHRANRCHAAVLWTIRPICRIPDVHSSKGYAGGFGTDLMLKDLGLSQENAIATKASTPLGGMARAIYAAHSIAGHGGEDFSSVIKMLQKKQA